MTKVIQSIFRCVPDSQRSFGLGIQWIVVRTLGMFLKLILITRIFLFSWRQSSTHFIIVFFQCFWCCVWLRTVVCNLFLCDYRWHPRSNSIWFSDWYLVSIVARAVWRTRVLLPLPEFCHEPIHTYCWTHLQGSTIIFDTWSGSVGSLFFPVPFKILLK